MSLNWWRMLIRIESKATRRRWRRSGQARRANFKPWAEVLEDWTLLSATALGTDTLLSGYGQLPLSFEANQGQTDAQVNFLSRGSGYALFLTATGAVLSLQQA